MFIIGNNVMIFRFLSGKGTLFLHSLTKGNYFLCNFAGNDSILTRRFTI